MEGRGIREKARNTSGRDEEKTKGEDKKRAWKDEREEEVREYIVKKRNGINLKRVRERDKEMWGRRRRRRRVGRRRKRKVVWWRVASWQLCREKTDPPLLPPQTVFWVALGRLLAGMIMKLLKLPTHSELDYPHSQTIIGASLMSTPHTSETALQRRVYNVYVCPFVCSHIMSTC